MLETKDQRQKRKCSSKTKDFQKIFSGDLKKKGLQKNFQAISRKNRFPKYFLGPPQTFNNSKNTAVLDSRTGQVSRTGGFKAKDFKMCPRGLQLCVVVVFWCDS